jgi:heptosyltransferase III
MDEIGLATPPPPIRRILLLQPRWMGDVLLCTPAIREARRAFPAARIDFVTEAAGAEVLRRNPHLDEVIVAGPGAVARLRLAREVWRGGYDAVVDFRSTGSTTQLAIASRAPLRVGVRGRGPRNLAYHRLADPIRHTQYAARHKLEMLAPLGVPVERVTDLSLDLPVGEAARDRAARVWREQGLEGERVVAMTPVSRKGYKQWGEERWARVADELAGLGARVLLTAAPSEGEQVRRVVEAMRTPPIWRYGPTSLEELAALLERCALWVGNDGGAKHVAASAGIPTVAVMRWTIGPVWNDPDAIVPHLFLERPPPQGCDLRCPRCPHRGCLGAVEIDDVVRVLRETLPAPRA